MTVVIAPSMAARKQLCRVIVNSRWQALDDAVHE